MSSKTLKSSIESWKGLWVLFGVIASVALTTYIAQVWTANLIKTEGESVTKQAAVDALNRVESDFREIQNGLVSEARTLARSPRIIRGLREFKSDGISGVEDIIRLMSAYELRDQIAVEVYTQEPRLIGWAGTTMPLDDAPEESDFLKQIQVKIARDGPNHAAISIWHPVLDGSSAVGAIRILSVIEREVQVRNEFLRDFSLSDGWSLTTGLQMAVAYADAGTAEFSDLPTKRVLRGLDGRQLLHVTVTAPTLRELLIRHRNRYLDVMYVWVLLALIAILFAIGRWCLASAKSDRNVRQPLARFVGFMGAIVAVRYALIAMDVPGRWQPGKAPLSPLFDPRHLASDFGWGIMQSTGDLLVSSIALVVLAMVFVRATEPVRRKVQDLFRVGSSDEVESAGLRGGDRGVLVRLGVSILFHGLITLALVFLLSKVARHSVLDSTLDFFERAGLLPGSVVMVVFTALLLWTFAVIFISSRALWVCLELGGVAPTRLEINRTSVIRALIGATLAIVALYILVDFQNHVEWVLALLFIVTGWLVALFSPLRTDRIADWLQLRSVIPSVVLVSLLLYPILEDGLAAERKLTMTTTAESYQEDVDSRIIFAIGQVLNRADEVEIGAGEMLPAVERANFFDSTARVLTQRELIAALGSHDVSVTIFDIDGSPLGRYVESGQPRTRVLSDESDSDAFQLIRAMYEAGGNRGQLIEKMTGRQDQEQFPYGGFTPIVLADVRVGWVLVRAHPEENAPESERAFPRVLTPAGFYGNQSSDVSVAEFQNGILTRSYGRTFGRSVLDAEIDAALNSSPTLWRKESTRDRDYISLYVRPEESADPTGDAFLDNRLRTIAVRQAAVGIFDHLYYLLRITMAGLFIGMPVYLIGIAWRVSRGLLPARKVRFRDRVLNAFFVAGIVTVTATGWVGLRVVTGENDRAIESWLRQHLERVEATLLIDASSEELPYSVLERSDLDSLSARVGLDLNVYLGAELEASSRPQLVKERLIGARLPVEAYEALFLDGFRYVNVNQTLGDFKYTAGYRALLDERGMPRYVLSLPTLPEQERIEEERARTLAYLFGALLVLVLVVMVTAALLANALARPIAGLRAGLEAVSAGRFERIGPVGSRDEIADLVDTFNSMQSQLEDSRYLLAKQERQLAWREMARQVAHEIRNPLTPMKLAVQHLQKAFSRDFGGTGSTPSLRAREDFSIRFGKTTTTLVEQIDALANIAEEFSSFGRFPQQTRSALDLNDIVTAAVHLMRNESRVKIDLILYHGRLVIQADEEAIRRIIINLIKNALQAIGDKPNGHILIESQLDVESGETLVAVARVTDNGSGIPEELWSRIFVPSFSTKTSGTGLGLAIARKTIEDHDGDIGFETEEGRGSTFWIRLACTSDDDA